MRSWHLVVYAPAYNVENSISELVDRIRHCVPLWKRRGVRLEAAIIVNDGSTDRTRSILARLAKTYSFLHPLHHIHNQGPVNAVLRGMQSSLRWAIRRKLPLEKTIFVRMDSDLEHRPEDIEKLLDPIVQGKTALAVGYVPLDSRSGRWAKWFNEHAGRSESRQFLGVEIPQFCPGFNVIRGDLFHRVYPLLTQKAGEFERFARSPMVAIDFVVLVLAKQQGEPSTVVRLPPINEKWAKKASLGKLLSYLDLHRKTVAFLKSAGF